MRVEILGSGGAITTPRPSCQCRVCAEAREKGIPYSRSGPSVFVHGPDVLIDTPEEIKDQLNRARIGHITAVFYSHWHPDHTMGRRLFETRNMDFRGWPQRSRCTDVYLPPKVAEDFQTRLGLKEHFEFMARHGTVQLHVWPDDEWLHFGGWDVRHVALAADYVYAFLFQRGETRVLIAMDELIGWEPPGWLRGVDLAVLPAGVFEFNPFTGERQCPADHPLLRVEATYRQTLDMVEALSPRRVVLSHIEEPDGLTYDDLCELERRLRAERGWDVRFAYDGMVLEVGASLRNT
ncbi:MAG: hypothetical protein GXP39_06450 [Chloroflexi bacterium]|nr:hypothetical protein [Chloroflexota bacterium]